jgi:hypothetical protein
VPKPGYFDRRHDLGPLAAGRVALDSLLLFYHDLQYPRRCQFPDVGDSPGMRSFLEKNFNLK